MIYINRMASRRGMRRCSNFTAGARAKARIAAMESKMSERAKWDAAHKITAVSAIQASMLSGTATRRNHFALALMSNRHSAGKGAFICASPIDAEGDEREIVFSGLLVSNGLPHLGQNVAASGQFAPQCIQYMVFPPVPNDLTNAKADAFTQRLLWHIVTCFSCLATLFQLARAGQAPP